METVRCPELLAAVVAQTRSWSTNHDEEYRRFLRLASESMERVKSANVSIEASYIFTSMDLGNVDDINTNSLILVFSFYCKIQHLTNSDSFSEVENKNRLMNFYELEAMARDFDIVPRFITREEIKTVWRNMSFEHIRNGQGHLSFLDFDAFKEVLIRLALAMYNKPGLKKLIKATIGTYPSPSDIVEYFCHYMKLDDLTAIKLLLRTKGRATQGKRNMRSQHEVSTSVKEMLDQEKEGRRMLQEIREGKLIKHHNTTKKKLLLNKSLTTLAHVVGKNKEVVKKPFENTPIPKISHGKSLLPSSLQTLFEQTRSNIRADLTKVVKPESDEVSVAGSAAEEAQDGNDNESVNASSVATKSTTELQQEYMSEITNGYHNDLKKFFERYCYDLPGMESSDVFHSEAPFVDLGVIPVGIECKLNFQIVNTSRDDIHLDVTCEGLQSNDMHLSTLPPVLVPGFTKNVNLRFTVEGGYRSVLGFFNVYILTPRTQRSECIQCPIFYRVMPDVKVEDINCSKKCSLRLLPELMNKYCKSHMTCAVNFQTQTGTWRKSGGNLFNRTDMVRSAQGSTRSALTNEHWNTEEFRLK